MNHHQEAAFEEYLEQETGNLSGNSENSSLKTGPLSVEQTEKIVEDSKPRSISPLSIRQNSATESTPKSPNKMLEVEIEDLDLCQTCHSRKWK